MDLKPLMLLLLSLALLLAGNFIQFDDTSGFGGDDILMPYGDLALQAVTAAVILSLRAHRARRPLGIALLVLDCLIVVEAWTNPGFRFIWSGDEGELFMFEVALLLTGLALLTRSVYRPVVHPAPAVAPTPQARAPGRQSSSADAPEAGTPGGQAPAVEVCEMHGDVEMTGWARFVAYLSATAVLTFFAFFIGVVQFETTQCGDSSGECTVSILGGFIWAAGAIVLSVLAIISTEASLELRKGEPRA
jgi:hypothetical protein